MVAAVSHRVLEATASTLSTERASAEANLVIAADGAWSRVRPLISDAAPEYSSVSYLDVQCGDTDIFHLELASLHFLVGLNV